MGYYKKTLKKVNKTIEETKKAISINKMLVKDGSPIVSSLKSTIANMHREGKDVSQLAKELHQRRSFLRSLNDAQVHNRDYLREQYALRRALISEWIADEES